MPPPPSLTDPFDTPLWEIPHIPCTALFSRGSSSGGSSFFGCSSPHKGEALVSALVPFTTQAELDAYVASFSLSNPPASLSAHFHTAVLSGDLFTASTVKTLTTPPCRVNSFLIVDASSPSSTGGTSPAPSSPNGAGTPSANLNPSLPPYAWNQPFGDGLEYLDLHGVPMSLVTDAPTASYLIDLAHGNVASSDATVTLKPAPNYAAAFNYYMGAANMSSEKCLSWRDKSDNWTPQCLPLGGQSVWSLSSPLPPPSSSPGVVLVGAQLDGSSAFHDLSPSASAAASAVLATLLAARSVGSLATTDREELGKGIAFALFQGDSYGFVGSRNFFKDTVSEEPFVCDAGAEVAASPLSYEPGVKACTSPPRTSLAFSEITSITDMIALDQVGGVATASTFFAHGFNGLDPTTPTTTPCGIDAILRATTASSYAVSASSVTGGALPPTPLSSLVSTAASSSSPFPFCGAALTGYNDKFTSPLYRSHLDVASSTVDLAAVCAAATIAARAAVATALDQAIVADAVAWAAEKVPEIDPDDPYVQSLATCLFDDGNCDLVGNSVVEEAYRQIERVGYNPSNYRSFGSPPNYYVGVYDMYNSQPYLVMDGHVYGATSNATPFNVDPENNFMQLRPSALELTLASLLDSYLGSAFVSTDPDSVLGASCTAPSDCANITCAVGSTHTCAQTSCTCKASHFHVALDEGLRPANGTAPAFFEVLEGVIDTPMWTEPNWADVGVVVFSDGQYWKKEGMEALGWIVFIAACFAAWGASRHMKKVKML